MASRHSNWTTIYDRSTLQKDCFHCIAHTNSLKTIISLYISDIMLITAHYYLQQIHINWLQLLQDRCRCTSIQADARRSTINVLWSNNESLTVTRRLLMTTYRKCQQQMTHSEYWTKSFVSNSHTEVWQKHLTDYTPLLDGDWLNCSRLTSTQDRNVSTALTGCRICWMLSTNFSSNSPLH